MPRRLLASGTLLLLLAGCGGGGSSSGDIACTQQFWNGVIALCLPDGWSVVERERLDERGIPPEVLVAFQADKAVAGQLPTITVTSERLKSPLDSATYSKASIRSVTTLPQYKFLDSRTIDVDGQSVDLHIFTAQPLPEEPERRYYQLSAVAANIGYVVTALTPVAISDSLEKQLTLIFGSVGFTEPKEEEKE